MIGESAAIRKTIEQAKLFAETDYSLLLVGETGTGKEIFAQSIHNNSKRCNGPWVVVNCAALPENILESELFGYVGGAFTGANKDGKPGLFEVAHGGTIFLDEIAEMDYVNQGRLLRVLQEKTVVRLGSYKVLPIDVRVIAATNKDLDLLIRENKFRIDLYYRLNVLCLNIMPLRERKEDIKLFIGKFLREFYNISGRTLRLTNDTIKFLEEYNWPGNIRELKNLVQRITVTAKVDTITCEMIKEILHSKETIPVLSTRENRQVKEIREALKEAKGNCTAAARILGIHRMTLHRRIKKLNIDDY
ncbi:MAG: sigma 54-interacting transcriptional regulator [Acidaminococcales bacterium]|nr:sigma 54-interacting transcriptional regulator [Acidaminococcales bacterium]